MESFAKERIQVHTIRVTTAFVDVVLSCSFGPTYILNSKKIGYVEA